MHNTRIRQLIKNSRLYHYEIANKIGVSEYTLCKWLRNELTDKQRERIMQAIEELQQGARHGE